MSKIAIIAALPGELKPLIKGWQPRGRDLWLGSIGDHKVVAVAAGMGAAAAERAVKHVFAETKPEILVSYGWAGALTCAVKPPDAYAVSEVIDSRTGEHFATNSPGKYHLLTLDRVAHVNEKRSLAQQHQAVLVDMEAATVARAAAERNLAFYCFKGVSDGYTDLLPDFNSFIDNQGKLRMGAFLTHVSTRPKYWSALRRLGGNSRGAASALAGLVRESFRQ